MSYLIEIPRLPENTADMNQCYAAAVGKLNRPFSIKHADGVRYYYGSKLDYLLPNTKDVTTVRSRLPEARDYLRRSRELGEILDESGTDEYQVNAFIRGSAAGLLLVEEVHARKLMEKQILTAAVMAKIMRDEMIIPEFPSLPIEKSEYTERAIDAVNDGLDVVGGQALAMIDKWARDYGSENRLAFHMGVGASALLGYKAHQEAYREAYHRQELQKLENQIDAVSSENFDWDKALSELNRGDHRR